MISTAIAALGGAAVMGGAGWAGAAAGRTLVAEVTPLADGPLPGRAPVAWLIASAGLLGAVVAAHAAVPQVALEALLVFALAAAWCSDVLRGVVPDVCTLGPLAAVLALALVEHRAAPWISAAIVCAPFALAAALSKGRGMGWGDVKLAALGGAVIGAQAALLAFAAASAVAVVVHRVTGNRSGPIALAPYLVAGIGAALLLGALA